MKSKVTIVLTILAVINSTAPSMAQTPSEPRDPLAITADTLLVRPLCFVSTVVGSALFAVSLPVAAISKSVKPTADALVVKPAQATFTRPLGDFDSMAY